MASEDFKSPYLDAGARDALRESAPSDAAARGAELARLLQQAARLFQEYGFEAEGAGSSATFARPGTGCHLWVGVEEGRLAARLEISDLAAFKAHKGRLVQRGVIGPMKEGQVKLDHGLVYDPAFDLLYGPPVPEGRQSAVAGVPWLRVSALEALVAAILRVLPPA